MSSARAFGNMLGVIGAGMVGYQKGQDQKAERERRQRAEENEQKQRDRTEREQKRQDEIRASMAEAYGPTTVEAEPSKPDTMDDRDVGQPGEQKVGGYVTGGRMVDGYREGGQRYATKGEADQAAAAYNAPSARATRMADVLGSNGEAAAATNLRAAARQERMGELQLSEAEQAHINKMFEQSLDAAGTPDVVADLVSKSGLGGALQLKAVPSQDDKTFTFQKVHPDGSMTPASNPFANTPQGLMEAKVSMSKAIPLAQKLEHLYKARTVDADVRLKDARADYYRSAGTAATTRADKAGSTRADHFDEKQWDAAAKVEPSFVTFPDDMGGKGVESPELRLTYRAELNRLRGAGQMSPSEASEAARTVTLQLKNAASARVAAAREADPKSKLTELEAVRLILTEFEAARKAKPAPAGSAAAPGAAPAGPAAAPAAAPRAEPTALDKARARRVVAEQAVTKFGSRQRQQSPMAFQAAQAELAAASEAERALKQEADDVAGAEYDARARAALGTGPALRYPKP